MKHDTDTRCVGTLSAIPFCRNMKEYLTEAHKDVKSDGSFDISDWTCHVTSVPKQNDSNNCGVFVIKYADFRSRITNPEKQRIPNEKVFGTDVMPYYRRRTLVELYYGHWGAGVQQGRGPDSKNGTSAKEPKAKQ